MYFKGEDFVYTFNGENKTKEEIEKLIDYDTTVSIDGLNIDYFAAKKSKKTDEKLKIEELRNHILNNNTVDKEFTDIIRLITADSEEELIVLLNELCDSNKPDKIVSEKEAVCKNNIQEILKQADKHQEKNGGILRGVEFPFDTNESYLDRSRKTIEDWNRKEFYIIPPSKENLDKMSNDFFNRALKSGEQFKFNTTPENSNFGIKETEGKLDYELDWEFIQQMAERMGQNKGKYEPYNWKKLMDVEKLKQSLFRHIIEIMKSNYSDDGREYGHLESLADNAMMINYQLKNNSK